MELQPIGVQRGTVCEVKVNGRQLDDIEGLLFHEPGIEVLELGPVSGAPASQTFTAKLKIAQDCPLGARRVSLRTRTGQSELQLLHVSPFPVVVEQEPNNSAAVAQAVTGNVTVNGRITSRDVDCVAVQVRQGERISAEVVGMRLGRSTGRTLFDPRLEILTEDGELLAECDDLPLLWNDACISLLAPRDGRYIIRLRDTIYSGDARADYLLHVGNFPRPAGSVPSGGAPGTELTLKVLGGSTASSTFEQQLTGKVGSPLSFLEYHEQGIPSPTGLPFRYSLLENVLDLEPNQDVEHATPGTIPAAFNGVIEQPGDTDCYRFTAKKGERYQVDVYARRLRSGLDPSFEVRAVNGGKVLVANDDRIGVDSAADFTVPEDGDYVLKVSGSRGDGGPLAFYRAEVKPFASAISAQILDVARYTQPKITVHRGARFGFMVNVRRDNCSGPVSFHSDSLPAGVTLEVPESWQGVTQIPVVLIADEEAPLGGAASEVRLVLSNPSTPDVKVEGMLEQVIQMTYTLNQSPMWHELLTGIPVVVAEPLPFRCWVEPPQVPMVRGGSLQLIVRCERDPEFKGDIGVQTLVDAPGTTSIRSHRIPADKDFVAIPITAAAQAALQESLIAVRCSATVGNGVCELCTPYVPMRVEEMYLQGEFGQSVVQQGGEIPYVVKLTHRKAFEGEATAELVGLPAKVTAEPVKFNKDSQELRFIVKAAADANPATSRSVLCMIRIPEQGQEIPHQLGNGTVRVDPASPATSTLAATADTQSAPLSRLDQLRLQKKARQSATPAPSPSTPELSP